MVNPKFAERLKKLNASHRIKIKIRPETGKFFLDYYKNNKHERFQFDFSYSGNTTRDDYNLRVADEVRNRKEIERLEDQTGFSLINRLNNRTYLREFTESKILFKKSPGLYRYATDRFIKGYGNEVIIEKITEHDIKLFIQRLEKDNLSRVTIKNYISHINMILNFAVEDGIILKNPASKITINTGDVVKVFLTIPEVQILVNKECERPEIKNAFLFSCFTGLRISDIINLKWSNVKDNQLLFVQIKTKRIVSNSLSDTAIRILNDQMKYKRDQYVFHLLEKNRVRKHLKAWVYSAGVKKSVSFHTARHTFATMCLTSGIDIYTVSKLLGHRDLKTTQVYAKLIDKVKTEAVNKLPKM